MHTEGRLLLILRVPVAFLCLYHLKALPIPLEGIMAPSWLHVGCNKQQDPDKVERCVCVCVYLYNHT